MVQEGVLGLAVVVVVVVVVVTMMIVVVMAWVLLFSVRAVSCGTAGGVLIIVHGDGAVIQGEACLW